ncbi:MAG: LicD family protein [Lachnospiraceae bacterium]|nr:LicD family protein [Lachnospiraceae bacterium]
MTEIQEELLKILTILDKFCRENDIEYYVFGGTLIGAMRHKGFIPWDDDSDVIITRDNWLKFIEAAKKGLPEGITLCAMDLDPNMSASVCRFYDNTTTNLYKSHMAVPDTAGIPVDIIVMDPVPESKVGEYLDGLLDLQEFANPVGYYAPRNVAHVGRPYPYAKYKFQSLFNSRQAMINKISKGIFEYPTEESTYYAQRFGGTPLFYPKEIFGKPKYVPFENTMLPVPEQAGTVLTLGYGEWVHIPRGGASKSQHDFSIKDFHNSSKIYFDEFNKALDHKAVMRTYNKRKKYLNKYTTDRVNSALSKDVFLQAKVCLDYEKKLKDVNISELLANKKYAELNDLLGEYIRVQCDENYTGVSSVSVWKRYIRRHHPLLIDIGDDAITAAVELLIEQYKVHYAEKVLFARDSITREKPERIKELEDLCAKIRIAENLYEQKDLEKCEAVIKEGLGIFEDNPCLYILNLRVQMDKGLTPDEIIRLAEEGMARFGESSELLHFKAEALLAKGEKEEALKLYEYIISFSDHGVVLTAIKSSIEAMLAEENHDPKLEKLHLEVRKQVGEEDLGLEEYLEKENAIKEKIKNQLLGKDEHAALKEEYLASYTVDESIKNVRLNLLNEIDDICKENNITYYLWNDSLLQAFFWQDYCNTKADLRIAMDTANIKKFIEAVNKKNQPGRALNYMGNNEYYHRFNVKYCNTDTLDFHINFNGEGDTFGMYVSIEILRNRRNSKIGNAMNTLLEVGYQMQSSFKAKRFRNTAAYDFVKVLMNLTGRKKFTSNLFNRLLKEGQKDNQEELYTVGESKKKTYYEKEWLGTPAELKLGDRFYPVPEKYKRVILKKRETVDILKAQLESSGVVEHTRFVDAHVSSQEYLDYLKKLGVDRKKIWDFNLKTAKELASTALLTKQTNVFWDTLYKIGLEIKRKTEGKTPEEFYTEKEPEKLVEVLDDLEGIANY